MEAIRTVTKCIGIISMFILPMLAIAVGYFLFISFTNSSHIFDIANLL